MNEAQERENESCESACISLLHRSHRLAANLLLVTKGRRVEEYPPESGMIDVNEGFGVHTHDSMKQLMKVCSTISSIPPHLSKEFLTVVRLLVNFAARQCEKMQSYKRCRRDSVKFFSQLVDAHLCDDTLPMVQWVSMTTCLEYAWVLVMCGIRSCRDVRELLVHDSSTSHGLALQSFVLQTLQIEFAIMWRVARGFSSKHCECCSGTGAEQGLYSRKNANDSILCSYFHYYASRVLVHEGANAQSLASKGSRTEFSLVGDMSHEYSTTKCRESLKHPGWSYKPQNARRLLCRGSAALLWSLAIVEALGNETDEELAQQFSHPGGFMDFVGEVVCVCAGVIYPFFSEQLKYIRALLRRLPTTAVELLAKVVLANDAQRYERNIQVVERFLWSCNPAGARRIYRLRALTREPLLGCKDEGTRTMPGDASHAQGSARGKSGVGLPFRRLEARDQSPRPLWEPLAPALAAHLSARSRGGGTMAWRDVVNLFSDVKQFREVELLMLWRRLAQLRRKTHVLSTKVVSLQRTCGLPCEEVEFCSE
uniref:Uncharacterized protein n=1 Tax=Trypanosoma congolense (strain IL3000) TaxID=1068625 RepID=G0UVP7_TRYCI|nr:conserved hypothetical protein [Trypanosoma congolense IL3000]